MNFAMDVLRWVTVRALRGKTWAGDMVLDSPSQPADIRTKEQRQPFIAVYVDEADLDTTYTDSEGRLISNPTLMDQGGYTATLVLDVGVVSAVKFGPTGEQLPADAPLPEATTLVTQLNATDEGLESQIGFISHQAVDTLLSTNIEGNPWAQMWRMLTASKIRRAEVRRGGPAADARTEMPRPRYASRVTIIHTGLLGVPPRGAGIVPGSFWDIFLKATEGDPELGGISALVRAHIERPGGNLSEWHLAQKYLGIPAESARALGIAPPIIADMDPPQLQTVDNLGHKMSRAISSDYTTNDGDDDREILVEAEGVTVSIHNAALGFKCRIKQAETVQGRTTIAASHGMVLFSPPFGNKRILGPGSQVQVEFKAAGIAYLSGETAP